MGIRLNIGGLKIGGNSFSWTSYWATHYITALSVLTTSKTTQTITATIIGSGFDNCEFEYSLNGYSGWTVDGTSITGIYNAMGLTPDVPIWWRARLYKGTNYGNYSPSAGCNTFISSFSDGYLGTTIDTEKWGETDPNSSISQNNALILTIPHTSNISEFTNKLTSVNSIASGDAVAQSYLTWTTDKAQEPIAGMYLYRDNSNFASVTARGGSGVYRLRIYTGGVSRYDFNTAITKAKNIKIWTDGTDIKFFYWDTTALAWVQMGSTQTYSLNYPLYHVISFVDNTVFEGGNPCTLNTALFCSYDYSTLFPYYKRFLSYTSYCWFARPKAIYNSIAEKTWIGQVYSADGINYSQYILTVVNATGAATIVQVGTVVEKDDHNEPTILVRASDSRLFTCYAEHASSTNIRYRISTNPLDASAWGAEQTKDVGGGANHNVTYPSCFQASNGDIFIFFRDLYYGWSYIKSTDDGVTFSARTIFYYGGVDDVGEAGTGRGYMTFAQSPLDADIIHMVTTDGHPGSTDHTVSVFGVYFDMGDSTVHKLDGTDVTAHIPLADPQYMTIIMTNTLPDTGWIEDVIVDSTGKPRFLFTFFPNGKNISYDQKDLYYAEWNGTAITTPVKIHTALNRNIGTNAIVGTYAPLACFDKNNPDVIIASKEVDGVCEIFKIIRMSSSSFASAQITKDSMVDNWRPFTVAAPLKNAFWLTKNSYITYTDMIEWLAMRSI